MSKERLNLARKIRRSVLYVREPKSDAARDERSPLIKKGRLGEAQPTTQFTCVGIQSEKHTKLGGSQHDYVYYISALN